MVVLENAQAPKSYTVKLDLAKDIKVVNLSDGGAVFVGSENLVVGSILAPWALDAGGKAVPITQTVTTTSVTITVDTSSVTAWPVIADPAYHTFQCHSHNLVTTTGTASQYLNGLRCPRYEDITARDYYPQWIEHWGRWRVARGNGDCTGIPERLDTWRPQSIIDVLISVGLSRTYPLAFGVIYDFNQACKGHDYCYDLGHAGRLDYDNVSKSACDSIMYNDMKFDCTKRRLHVRPLCNAIAAAAYNVVWICPEMLCFS